MYDLVFRILVNHKAVVEEIPRVAFFTIAVKHLDSLWDINQTLNGKASVLLDVVPYCLFGQSVVQHICKGSEDVGLDAID